MSPVRIIHLRQRSKILDFAKSVGNEPFANSTYKPKVGACFFYSQLKYLSTASSYVVI